MHTMKIKGVIILVAVLTFNFAIAGNAAATAFTVSNDTALSGNFTSIQAAVDAANPGDEIIVKPGVYTENIEITKALSLLSESDSPSDTIIQAADGSKDVIGIWANEVSIKGFGITGSDSASGVHFFCVTDCLIEHNILSDNICGIDLSMFSSGNMLLDNEISNSSTGISLRDSLNNTLKNNSILYCKSGISLFDSPNNTLNNNTISENEEGISLIGESNGNLLVNNTFKFNKQVGMYIHETSSNMIYNNYFNNTENVKSEMLIGENFWNTTKSEGSNIVGGSYLGGNFWGKPDGTVYPRGARDLDLDGIFDSAYDIEGSGSVDYLPLKESNSTIITVSNGTDYAADFSSIQAAVDNSYPGDTILVYPGVYTENIEIGVEDLAIISASDSPEDTIIQAARSSDDVFFVTADGVGINGFCIRGNISYPSSGIHLYDVEDCRIENNELFVSQEAFRNSSGNSTPAAGNNSSINPGFGIHLDLSGNNTLENNTISYSHACIFLNNASENILFKNRVSNSSYGVWVNYSTGNILDNNSALDNKLGIYLKASSGNSVVNSVASNNSGSCINLWNSSENMLCNNIASNSSSVCIILNNSRGNSLSNNTVSHSKYGIWLAYSSDNNSLNGNTALYNSVGIYLKASKENTLDSNRAENNSNSGIYLWNSVENELINNKVSYSDVSISLYNASMNMITSNTAAQSNYGIWLNSLSNDNIISESEVSNNRVGIYLKASRNNVLRGNSADLNTLYGIFLSSSSGNTVNANRVISSSKYGMYIVNSSSNRVYDNYLNNTKNLYFDSNSSANIWNVSKTPGSNIVGGSFLGGNYWASPAGNGFSQTAQDVDYDGICDTAYNLDKENTDYLPLAGSF